MTTEECIQRLPEEVRPHCYVVGKWVWAEFEAKPDQETRKALRDMGFRWNRKRGCWQNPCGYHTRAAQGYDPRWKYGAVPVTDLDKRAAQ
jgi:hypothetical protein